MQTATITITEEAYQTRQDALDTLTTRALRKERTAIAREVAVAERQASGEDHFSLTCLLEWAGWAD